MSEREDPFTSIPCDEAKLDSALEDRLRTMRKSMGDKNADGVISTEEVAAELTKNPEGNLANLLEATVLESLGNWKVSHEVITRKVPKSDVFEVEQSRLAALRITEQEARIAATDSLNGHLDEWKISSPCDVEAVVRSSSDSGNVEHVRNGLYGLRVIDAVAVDIPELYEKLSSKLDMQSIETRIEAVMEATDASKQAPEVPRQKSQGSQSI